VHSSLRKTNRKELPYGITPYYLPSDKGERAPP